MQYYDNIIEYSKKLVNADLGLMGKSRIYYKVDNVTYATRKGAYFPNLTEEDIIDISSGADFIKATLTQRNFNAAIECKPEYIGKCIEKGVSLPSVLDDCAMIVGRQAKLINMNRKELASALKFSSAVLIRDGAAIVFGRTLYEAFTTIEVLEKNAKIFIKAEVLGGAHPVNPANSALERLVYEFKYSTKENNKHLEAEGLIKTKTEKKIVKSFNDLIDEIGNTDNSDNSDAVNDEKELVTPVYENPDEAALRQELIDYGNKLVEEGLVKGTWGNLSVRLDDNYMLCTPSGLAYDTLKPEDIVKVNLETLEYSGDLKPTSEKKFHAGIYIEHPSAGAVVHTHSTYSCVFASAGKSMSLKSNVLRNTSVIRSLGLSVPCAKYGLSGTDKLTANVLSSLSDNVACFMKHHGMVCYGSDMQSAFNRAVLVEDTAREQINKKYYK